MNYYSLISSMNKIVPSTLMNNLIAVYKAESNANDSLGNYNGTPVGGLTYTAGKSGNAFTFNGTTAYVDMGDVMDVGINSWTYSFWFNANSITDYTSLFSKMLAGSSQGRIISFFEFGKLVFFFQPETSINAQVASTTTISTNTWYHVTLVLDRLDKLKIYLNGTLNNGTASNNNLVPFVVSNYNTNHPFRIGAQTAGNNVDPIAFLNGKIDEFNVWNRVLTTTEITELYNAGTGKFYPYYL
jgi:hypothetical protein